MSTNTAIGTSWRFRLWSANLFSRAAHPRTAEECFSRREAILRLHIRRCYAIGLVQVTAIFSYGFHWSFSVSRGVLPATLSSLSLSAAQSDARPGQPHIYSLIDLIAIVASSPSHPYFFLRQERSCFMRFGRRRPFSKRQDGLVLQPGGTFLIDSNSEAFTASTLLDSQSIASDSVSKAVVPSESGAPASVLFSPDDEAGIVSRPATSTTLPPATNSNAPPLSISNPLPSNSADGSDLTAPSMTLSYPASSASTAASALPTSSFSPTIHISEHSMSFIAGMTFLGIAVVACILTLVVYVTRLKRNRSSWCFGLDQDDDVERQDSYVRGIGIGMLAGKPNTTFDTPKHSTSLDGIHVIPQLLSCANSPGGRYPMRRPAAPHVDSDESIETPTKVLGPLEIKNYARGDFTSSCDESGHLSSPCAPSSQFGTPRERQAPFLGLSSGRLSLPLTPVSRKPEATPAPASLLWTRPIESTVEGSKRKSDDILPLPIPPFDSNLCLSNEGSRADGWGAALRTSIYNALSGLSAPAKAEDKYTTFAASDAKSSERWRNTLTSRGPSALEQSDSTQIEDAVQGTCFNTGVIGDGSSFSHEAPIISSSASTDHGLGISVHGNALQRRHPIPVPPLLIRKKQSSRSSRKTRRESLKAGVMSSRANSIYSPCPDTSKLAQCLRGTINSRTCFTPGGSHNSSKNTHPSTMPSRPQFLRQPTAGSICSFSSESSEMGDAELRVKQTLALRARRKRTMEMGVPLCRSGSASAIGSYVLKGNDGNRDSD